MQIAQIEGLTGPNIAALQAANWTVATLATATAADLTIIRGIGAKAAKKAIAGAQEMINQHKLYESRRLEFGDSGSIAQIKVPIPMTQSVRVARIQEGLNVHS